MTTNYMQFTEDKMEKFIAQDALLRFVVKDLQTRGNTKAAALEITFNSYVLGDSVMEDIYKWL